MGLLSFFRTMGVTMRRSNRETNSTTDLPEEVQEKIHAFRRKHFSD